jgi:regulator of protease activity HflC (stomatin/prohibitin superfamily)
LFEVKELSDDRISIAGILGAIAVCIIVLYVLLLAADFVFGWGAFAPFVQVPAGQVAVQDTFGNVDNKALVSGLQWKNPLTSTINFNTKTQALELSGLNVLTSEGLQVGVHATVLMHIDPQKAPELYKTVGGDYNGVLTMPEIRAVIRDEIALYKAEGIYSNERGRIAATTNKKLNDRLNARGIYVESVLIRDVDLPESIAEAIQRKQTAQQQIQQSQFELDNAKIQAEKARVEAQGKADALAIMSQKTDDKNLAYEWIQAIKNHPGAVIYLPTDPNAVELIRNA